MERVLRTEDGSVDTIKEVDLIVQEILDSGGNGGSARLIRVAEAVANEALEAIKKRIEKDLRVHLNK